MVSREALSRLHEYVPGERRPGVLKLSSNENPLGSAPSAVAAIQSLATTVSIYPDGGATRLRAALAERHGVTQQQVITGNGSDEIMVMAAAAVVNPGDVAVTAEHTFSVYGFATNLFDGRVVSTPMTDGRHNVDHFLSAVAAEPSARVVFFCNPNNPTGTYVSESEILRLLDGVPPHVLVVLDEAYCEYMDAPDAPDGARLVDRYPNLLVLRTFSKIYGLAGLRVGYGIAQEPIISLLEKTRMPFNTNLVAQEAALAALDDEKFVERSLRINRAGRERLGHEMDARGYRYYPTQANFLCIHVDQASKPFCERVAANGVTIRPLTSFGLPDWIRVTIGTDEQIDRFLIAFDAAASELPRRAHATAG